MAAHLVFGNIVGGEVVFRTNFTSVELSDGTTHTHNDASRNYLRVTAIGDIYIAFSEDKDANPTASPRFRLNAGQSSVFAVKRGTKIKTIAVS